MILTILFSLWGFFDWTQMSGCFMLNACIIGFGDMFEVQNSGKKKKDIEWTGFYYGAMCGIVPWTIMSYAIIRLPDTAMVKWYVWVFVAFYFVLFFTFPGTLIAQYTQYGKWNDELYPLLPNGGYTRGEKTFLFLSLISKSVILWTIAAAVYSEGDVDMSQY